MGDVGKPKDNGAAVFEIPLTMADFTPKIEAAGAPSGLAPDSGGPNLDAIRKTVEDAASVSGGLWLSYLLTLFYFAVAACSVTHVDLFLDNPVKAPFLNVDLPLRAFFSLAPLIFLTIHAYTLVNFVMLGEKAKWYHAELKRQIPGDYEDGSGRNVAEERDRLRRQLPSNIFVQFLAGPKDMRESAFGLLLKLIVWSTLVVAPILLLLLMEMKFLPYHDAAVIWLIRGVLCADIGLVWWLWHAVLLGRGDERTAQPWMSSRVPYALASTAIVFFSVMVATFPGEPLNAYLSDWWGVGSLQRGIFHPNETAKRGRGFFSDTLVLRAFDILQVLKIDDLNKVESRPFVFSAHGRDLRGAVFDSATLSRVDFGSANLEGASFSRVQMRQTAFLCANLASASFDLAQMQGASFRAAELRRSTFRFAQGAGAFFDGARMTGACLNEAVLPGASFNNADLRNAWLKAALLDGASFGNNFQKQATCERRPEIYADLTTADLTGSSLRAVSFAGARLQNAVLDKANLAGVDFAQASVWKAPPPEKAAQNQFGANDTVAPSLLSTTTRELRRSPLPPRRRKGRNARSRRRQTHDRLGRLRRLLPMRQRSRASSRPSPARVIPIPCTSYEVCWRTIGLERSRPRPHLCSIRSSTSNVSFQQT